MGDALLGRRGGFSHSAAFKLLFYLDFKREEAPASSKRDLLLIIEGIFLPYRSPKTIFMAMEMLAQISAREAVDHGRSGFYNDLYTFKERVF